MPIDLFSTIVLLCKADQAIAQKHTLVTQLQKQCDALRTYLHEKQEAVEQQRKLLQQVIMQEHTLELETKSVEQQLIKAREKSLFCADVKAYDSIHAEIKALEKMRLAFDDQLMELWDKKAACESEIVMLEQAYQSKEPQARQQLQAYESDIITTQQELARLQQERKTFIPQLRDYQGSYEAMSQLVPDPIGVAHGAVCAACDMILPKHEQVRLAQRAIVTCPACFRLLYEPTVE